MMNGSTIPDSYIIQKTEIAIIVSNPFNSCTSFWTLISDNVFKSRYSEKKSIIMTKWFHEMCFTQVVNVIIVK